MIRKVEDRDVPVIADIYNGYISNSVASFEIKPLTEEEMRGRIFSISSHFPYIVEEEDGKVVGFAYAHLWKDRASYRKSLETTVYIHPDYQHKGIGTRLMLQLIEECRTAGYHVLIACITGSNKQSCRLHEKLGFHQVSLFKEVGEKFGKRLDVVDYELIL